MAHPRLLTALIGMAATVVGFVLLPVSQGTAAVTHHHRKPGTTVSGRQDVESAEEPEVLQEQHGNGHSDHQAVQSDGHHLVDRIHPEQQRDLRPGRHRLPGHDRRVQLRQGHPLEPVLRREQSGGRGILRLRPENTAYATTAPNGSGQADIQILIADQNQLLGCGVHHECSLVIVPAQGGDTLDSPINCRNHLDDQGGTDVGEFAFTSQNGQCSWASRIVIPLSFVPAPNNCAIKTASFTALGSPMLDRAIEPWIADLCAQSPPLTVTYNPAITEPEAIQDVPLGLGDVALTSRPGPTQIGTRQYTYAPIAISAVSIAYWLDNPVTGQPVTNLKLDPRLVAKLITQSYNFQNEGCGGGQAPAGIGCDNAVDGNPTSLFSDPEFRHLNPHVQAAAAFGGAFQIPTVESGHSDMTWQLTRWIADNKPANAFISGQFDQWGMHVNTDYLGLKYPLDSFTGQDNYPVIAHRYSPDFPLAAVDQLQAENWDNGTDWEVDPTTGNFPRDPIETPGERALFAIVDEGSAAAFRFPVAEIRNDKGHYVAPTTKSMTAALSSMVPAGSNHVTQQVNFGKQKADAYPLTMIIYAMVPTSGTTATKAAAIARFLDFAAGPGQHPGLNVGELPPGFVPLTAQLRDETLHAATLVANQAGNSPTSSPSPTASPGAGPTEASPTPSPSASSASPAPQPTATPTATPSVVTIALKSAQTAGMMRYALPVLLIFGGIATLAGASSLIVSSAGAAITERLRRVRRARPTLRRKQ